MTSPHQVCSLVAAVAGFRKCGCDDQHTADGFRQSPLGCGAAAAFSAVGGAMPPAPMMVMVMKYAHRLRRVNSSGVSHTRRR